MIFRPPDLTLSYRRCSCNASRLKKWMGIRINLCLRQRMAPVAQSERQLVQSPKASDAPIVLTKGHRKHPRYEHFDTAQPTGEVFGRGLIDYNDIQAMFDIEVDQMVKIVTKINAFWWIAIKILKGFLEGLLMSALVKEMQPVECLRQRVQQGMMVYFPDTARIGKHFQGLCSTLLLQPARKSQIYRKFAQRFQQSLLWMWM